MKASVKALALILLISGAFMVHARPDYKEEKEEDDMLGKIFDRLYLATVNVINLLVPSTPPPTTTTTITTTTTGWSWIRLTTPSPQPHSPQELQDSWLMVLIPREEPTTTTTTATTQVPTTTTTTTETPTTTTATTEMPTTTTTEVPVTTTTTEVPVTTTTTTTEEASTTTTATEAPTVAITMEARTTTQVATTITMKSLTLTSELPATIIKAAEDNPVTLTAVHSDLRLLLEKLKQEDKAERKHLSTLQLGYDTSEGQGVTPSPSHSIATVLQDMFGTFWPYLPICVLLVIIITSIIVHVQRKRKHETHNLYDDLDCKGVPNMEVVI